VLGTTIADNGVTRVYAATVDASAMARTYMNNDLSAITLSASGTGSSNERFRSIKDIQIDFNGYSLPYAHSEYQAIGHFSAVETTNSGATGASVDSLVSQHQYTKVGDGGDAGDITVSKMIGNNSTLSINAGSGRTMTVTDAYGAISQAEPHGGSGTVNLTNYYGFYVRARAGAEATNNYGFYVSDDTWSNRLGGIVLAGGDITTPAITIADNSISANRSNDNLHINASGTGYIALGGDVDSITTSTQYNYGVTRNWAGTGSGNVQLRPHADIAKVTLTGTMTGSALQQENRYYIDMAGYDITATNTSKTRGITGFGANAFLTNSSAAAVTATMGTGLAGTIFADAASGDLTLTEAFGTQSSVALLGGSGNTATVTTGYAFRSKGAIDDGGLATKTVGTLYHFYAHPSAITPTTAEYGFYTGNTTMSNYIGGVTLQNGTVSTDGIDIVDNEITTNRSNDNLVISANGTGQVELGVPFDQVNNNSRYDYGVNTAYYNGAVSNTRIQANNIKIWCCDTGQPRIRPFHSGRLCSHLCQR
jgi:hypothetical protein